MRIEIQGPQGLLEEFRLRLQDQLQKAGFSQGPKVTSMDRKVIDYTKGDAILNIEISHESEGRQGHLIAECETPIPEFEEVWDAALVTYGKEILERVRSFAIDKDRVKKEL
jgi:hypothetical protein